MKDYLITILISGLNEIEILAELNLNRDKYWDGFLMLLTNLTGPLTYILPLLLLALSRKNWFSFEKSCHVAVSVLLSALLVNILKYLINRPRPFIVYPFLEKMVGGGSPSFPSGHTSDAFALATSLSLAWPRWYIIIPSYLWATLVGYSRMSLGVHYPSDVLAGAIIGIGSAWLCFAWQRWRLKQKKAKAEYYGFAD